MGNSAIGWTLALRTPMLSIHKFTDRRINPVTSSSAALTVPVDLGSRSYDIAIVSDDLSQVANRIETWATKTTDTPSRTALIISDANVADRYAAPVADSLTQAGWTVETAVLEAGEQSKCQSVVSGLYDTLVAMHADRRTVVIAVGGGVVGDISGFVAASYARGIPFVQVPTTLLAQVDSSVGGKVGINHPQGKNLIGAFHQPLGVFIDTTTLDSLPDRDYRSGMAEVVKYGVILDEKFFTYLESHQNDVNNRDAAVLRHVVARCCQLKADVVERDEYERTGVRAVLNYGHTFAHAFETLSGYGELMHGEAVGIGMVYASRLAERRGLIDASLTERQIALFAALGIPTVLPDSINLSIDDILERMKLDKKAIAGRLRFVLPTKIGHVQLYDDVPEADVRAVLDALG
jgi:3-dehydroquinate synthase